MDAAPVPAEAQLLKYRTLIVSDSGNLDTFILKNEVV